MTDMKLPDRTMELSVIIPCRDAGATIATQLEALANQWWSKPWEIIVSDNGSTDNSMSIVNQYKGRLPNLRIIDSSAKKRQSYALNAGVRATNARAVAFCDADDEVAPGWVAEMGEALLRYDVAYGRMLFDKFNDPKQAECYARKWKDGLYTEQFLPHGAGCNTGVKRSVHQAINGFDECLPRFADGDYYWRLQLEGYKLHYVAKAMYQYRIGRTNRSLAYLYRRGRTAAACDYWLYKKYKPLGITKDMVLPSRRSTIKRSLVSWARLVKDMPYACFRGGNGKVNWLEKFVEKTGEVVGQFQGRLANPCKPYSLVRKRSGYDAMQS